MPQLFNLRPEIISLDISERSVKFLDIETRREKITKIENQIFKSHQKLVENGTVINREKLIEILKKIKRRTKKRYINLALPEEKSFIQMIKIPKVSEEKLEELVYYEVENYIPLSARDVYLDFQKIEPIKDHLKHYIILLVAVPRKIVDSYIEVIKSAGFQPFAFETEALAIVRALIPDQISYYPVLIIDIGKSRTRFIIFSGRSVRFSSSVSISADDFTKKIAKTFNLSLKEAEKEKIKKGIAPQEVIHFEGKREELKKEKISDLSIFNAVSDLLEKLTQEIREHLNYYYSHDFCEHLSKGNRKINQIILCGGGGYLKGLPEFLRKTFNIEVKKGNPWINFLPDDRKRLESHFKQTSLLYTTTAGLLLRDFYRNIYD
jgi:type IV pilus assembly protein PilM